MLPRRTGAAPQQRHCTRTLVRKPSGLSPEGRLSWLRGPRLESGRAARDRGTAAGPVPPAGGSKDPDAVKGVMEFPRTNMRKSKEKRNLQKRGISQLSSTIKTFKVRELQSSILGRQQCPGCLTSPKEQVRSALGTVGRGKVFTW